jgi:hypothetical protein
MRSKSSRHRRHPAIIGLLAIFLPAISATLAEAQPQVEVGASIISSVMTLEDDSAATVGIPTPAFGLLGNGAYGSLFLSDRFAVEPQIGFFWATFDGDAEHILNMAGQFTFFPQTVERRSPYLFASVGFVTTSGDNYTPKTYGAGGGYRIPVGDRLVLRVDARYTHYTSRFDGLDTLGIGMSIGGLFGRR